MLAGNFWPIFHALEEELEMQSVVAEALPLPRAFHRADEKLHKGEVGGRPVPWVLETALVQRWGWERAREGRICAEMPKGQQLGWDWRCSDWDKRGR